MLNFDISRMFSMAWYVRILYHFPGFIASRKKSSNCSVAAFSERGGSGIYFVVLPTLYAF